MFKLSFLLSFLAIFNISNAEIIEWNLQESLMPYAPIAMFAGDTITFQYPGDNIDVFLHPSGSCNDTGAELVGAAGAGNATYTFKDSQIDTNVTFACQHWNFCSEFGMIIDVLVMEPPPSSSPTMAPSKTAAPTTSEPTAAPVARATPPPTSSSGTPPDTPTTNQAQPESGAASMGAAVSLLLSAFVLSM